MTTLKERILQLIDYKGDSKEKIFDRMNVSYSNFKGEAKKKGLISDTIVSLMTIYPDVNLDWLLKGNGSMLRSGKGKGLEVGAAIPKEEWSKKLIPFYEDIPASASVSPATNDYPEVPNSFVRLPFDSDAQFFLPVMGDSMLGKFNPGTIIGYKEVEDKRLLLWGEPYLVMTSEYRLLKYVHKGSDASLVLLRSENPAHHDSEIPIDGTRFFRVRATLTVYD